MASGTLYSYPDNFRAAKALIAAQYSKADVKLDPNFVFGETNKTKDFLKKFPSGKVPAFESKDGKYLQDSNAIAYYVANEQLRGTTEYDTAEILQWIGFAESEVLPAACALVFPILGVTKKNDPKVEEAYARSKEDIQATLKILNGHLLTRTYLVGEGITLADIVLACNLLNPYKYAFDADFRKPFVNVNRWFTTLINQPEFKAILGQVQLKDKDVQLGGGEAKKKKDDKKKEKKQEKIIKIRDPHAEKPIEEVYEDVPAEKPSDPWATLPRGTFVMDDFKRVYSNEPEEISIPYFWEHFDPENYSLWLGEYRYPEELTKTFMSCNLITGMFQRLDKMRKQAFASVCLFGDDNNSSISGIWVWRGQDLAFKLSPDWQIDYESYDWKKLDPFDTDTKRLVAQYFAWTGVDRKGRPFNQGKIFK